MEFRKLRADEIKCRIAMVTEKGCQILLYKDARCDMNILDETVGADNWQRKHYEQKGNLFCSVGIKIGSDWIWKDDCGSESNTEAEKGEASDSFKRACVNWGIGRELYTSPFIWIGGDKCDVKSLNGKYKCYDTFKVTAIAINDAKEMTALVIQNDKRKCEVFRWEKPNEDIVNNSSAPARSRSKPNAAPRCDRCGAEITPIEKKDGSVMSVNDVIEYSRAKYHGNTLCSECMKSRSKEQS